MGLRVSVRGPRNRCTLLKTVAMRRPIQRQIAVPMLSVALVAIGVTSVMGAWLIGRENFRRRQQEQQRLTATLVDGGFPLTDSVLRKMAGLSGAQFVVLDDAAQTLASTIALLGPDRAQLAGALRAQVTGGGELEMAGERWSVERVPIREIQPGGGRWLLVLRPRDWRRRMAREGMLAPLAVGAGVALVVSGIAAHLARRWVRPLLAVRDQAQRIAAGDFRAVALPQTDDEIRDLTAAVNLMAQRLADYEQAVRRNERLRVLGQLGAGLAHQIRNAAAGASLAIELHARACGNDRGRESLQVAQRQLQLMEDQLGRLLTLGQRQSLRKAPVDAREIVDQAVELTGPVMLHAQAAWRWARPTEAAPLVADADAVRQAIVNLALNAIQALAGRSDGRMRFTLRQAAQGVEICVADNGPGPAPEICQRLFEPLVTTRPEGTGLGLAVVREIVESHGGTVDWRREEGWTLFTLRLPAEYGAERVAPSASDLAEADDGAVIGR